MDSMNTTPRWNVRLEAQASKLKVAVSKPWMRAGIGTGGTGDKKAFASEFSCW